MGHKSRKTVRISPQLRRGCGVPGIYMKMAQLPKGIRAVYLSYGAGDGNRTRVISLEGWGSTIELHLHLPLTVCNYKLFSFNCQYFFEIFLTFFFVWRKPPYSRGFQNTPNSKFINFINYALGFLIAACAAANLAIGTLNGEHDT